MRFPLLILLWAALLAGCGSPLQPATPTLLLVTSTLPPTIGPTATARPSAVAASPTRTAVVGTTTSQLNVRGDPSSASPPLGMIAAFDSVQIVAKDPSGNWYQILYPKAPGGLGWVTAQYVNAQNQDSIPIASAASGAEVSGVVLQQVNVRSAPSTNASALGTLNSRDTVVLTGRDSSGLWLQIRFPSGKDGTGWVAAGYVQAGITDKLPIVGQAGVMIGTPTPTGVPATAQPTPGVAAADSDSAQSPIVSIVFSPGTTGSFIYSSDLSAPSGDSQDWIQFTPYQDQVGINLQCYGEAVPQLALWLKSARLSGQSLPGCGTTRVLQVSPGQPYLLSLSISASQGPQLYVRYTVRINSLP